MNEATSKSFKLVERKSKDGHDTRHGGPYDRGSADYYYWREAKPHYYKGGSYNTDRVEVEDMTPEEISAYHAGYEEETDRKDYT